MIAPPALVRPAREVEGAVVQAVAARDPARARAFAKKHAIPTVHESYDALLRDPDLDAIYNPLPNGLHCEWTLKALEAGKHVLCEKPMASNAEQAERMAEASERTGRVLVEAFHWRYHPLAARMREVVRGELGEVEHFEAAMCVPFLAPGNIRYRYELAGGATMDAGCYPINMLRYLAGAEPEVVGARAQLASERVDRRMDIDLRFPDGRTGHVVCSLLSSRLLDIGIRGARLRGLDAGLQRRGAPLLPPASRPDRGWLAPRAGAGRRDLYPPAPRLRGPRTGRSQDVDRRAGCRRQHAGDRRRLSGRGSPAAWRELIRDTPAGHGVESTCQTVKAALRPRATSTTTAIQRGTSEFGWDAMWGSAPSGGRVFGSSMARG